MLKTNHRFGSGLREKISHVLTPLKYFYIFENLLSDWTGSDWIGSDWIRSGSKKKNSNFTQTKPTKILLALTTYLGGSGGYLFFHHQVLEASLISQGPERKQLKNNIILQTENTAQMEETN